MLKLDVKRHDGSPVKPEDSTCILFYDERIHVDIQAPKACDMHLYMTVTGSMLDMEHEHSVVIHDENLVKTDKWSGDIHVRHPRSPLQNPQLDIVVTARYATQEEEAAEANANGKVSLDRYLPPLRPIQSTRVGFLVPFGYDSKPSNAEPQLSSLTSSSRGGHARAISTISSSFDFTGVYEERETHQENSTQLVASNRAASEEPEKRAEESGGIEVFRWKAPLAQALELEIRSLRPALERDRIIAEIDLVAGDYTVSIDLCEVNLDGGLSDHMGRIPEAAVVLRPFEKYALCYNLQLRSNSQTMAVSVPRRPLIIALDCEVLLYGDDGEVAVRPNIRTEWTPIVDFEGTQGPLPKTPALNMNINSPLPTSAGSSQGPDVSSSTLALVSSGRTPSSSNLTLMGGITIMIMGPQFVHVGDEFEWNIKVMNRSQRNRIFTMDFGSLSQDLYRPEHPQKSDRMALLSNYNADFLRRRASNQYRSSANGRGIIPLSQELKVGNLASHVCFETNIQLKALSVGTHTIEGTKIEDSASRDSYDVGGLLEVIVEP